MIHISEPDRLEFVVPIHSVGGDFLGNAHLTVKRMADGSVSFAGPQNTAAILPPEDAAYLAAWLAQ